MPSFSEIGGTVGASAAMPGLASMLNPVVDMSNTFVGAIKKFLTPFEMMTNIATHFVSALAPSLVDDLARRFRDLNAVIGVAMVPIVNVARDLVRNLADHLLPIMKQLQPIIEDISDAIGGALNQAINDMSVFINDMMPTLKTIKDVFVGLVGILRDIWSAFTALSRSVYAMISGAFEGLMGKGAGAADMMAKLRDIVRDVIGNLIMFSARLMMSFGWTKGVEGLIKGLEQGQRKGPKEDSTGMAVGPAMFKSIGDLNKSTMLEAFRSSAQGGKEKDPAKQAADFLGKIQGQLGELLKNGEQTKMAIVQKIENFIDTLSTLLAPLQDFISGIAGDIKNIDIGAIKEMVDVKFQEIRGFFDETIEPFCTMVIPSYLEDLNEIRKTIFDDVIPAAKSVKEWVDRTQQRIDTISSLPDQLREKAKNRYDPASIGIKIADRLTRED